MRAYRAAPAAAAALAPALPLVALAARTRARALLAGLRLAPAGARRRRRASPRSPRAAGHAAAGCAGLAKAAGDLRRHRRRRRRLRRHRRRCRRRSALGARARRQPHARAAARGGTPIAAARRRVDYEPAPGPRGTAAAGNGEAATAEAAGGTGSQSRTERRGDRIRTAAAAGTRAPLDQRPGQLRPSGSRRRGVRPVSGEASGSAKRCTRWWSSWRRRIGSRSPARASASARPPQPSNLRVDGGEESWHADNAVRLCAGPTRRVVGRATTACSTAGGAVAGRRSTRPSAGQRRRSSRSACRRSPASTRPKSGSRTRRAAEGPPADREAALRRRAGPEVAPIPRGSSWIGRTAFPYALRSRPPGRPAAALRHPRLRGLGRRAPGGGPLRADAVCADAETDLPGGIGDDTLAIGALPEGTATCQRRRGLGRGRRPPRRPATPCCASTRPTRSTWLRACRAAGRAGAGDADRQRQRRRLGNGAERTARGPSRRSASTAAPPRSPRAMRSRPR